MTTRKSNHSPTEQPITLELSDMETFLLTEFLMTALLQLQQSNDERDHMVASHFLQIVHKMLKETQEKGIVNE